MIKKIFNNIAHLVKKLFSCKRASSKKKNGPPDDIYPLY